MSGLHATAANASTRTLVGPTAIITVPAADDAGCIHPPPPEPAGPHALDSWRALAMSDAVAAALKMLLNEALLLAVAVIVPLLVIAKVRVLDT